MNMGRSSDNRSSTTCGSSREKLRGKVVQHINSTSVGGGVAEILNRMVPLLHDLGVDTRWDLIKGGRTVLRRHEEVSQRAPRDGRRKSRRAISKYSARRARRMSGMWTSTATSSSSTIRSPIALVERKDGNKWIWRCHIDVSNPDRKVWKFLRAYVARYDSAVFSAPTFSQQLPIRQFLIAPSIDPLSDKNRELPRGDDRGGARRSTAFRATSRSSRRSPASIASRIPSASSRRTRR